MCNCHISSNFRIGKTSRLSVNKFVSNLNIKPLNMLKHVIGGCIVSSLLVELVRRINTSSFGGLRE